MKFASCSPITPWISFVVITLIVSLIAVYIGYFMLKDILQNSELELILELMPDNIRKELNQLNIIPILRNEKLYFILPYHIDIN